MNLASLSPVRLLVAKRFVVNFAVAIFLTALNVLPDVPTTNVRMQKTADSPQTFKLQWDAFPNATYLLQSRTNLGSGDSWRTVDAITPSTALGVCEIKGRSIPENSVEFFQLVLPQRQIFSVEPAILTPGVPSSLYIVGQCFSSNDVLRINGVAQPTAVFQSSTLIARPAFTPDVPGDYLFELVVAGQVRSSFTVTCADAYANPELVLQGPPEEPLASPQFVWASKKGYDYYKAGSNMRSAGAHKNPYFQANNNEGEMPPAVLAAWLSKKGYDYYQASSARARGIITNKPGSGTPGGRTKSRSNIQNNRFFGDPGDEVDSVGAILGFNLQGRDNDRCVMPSSGEVQYQALDLAVEGRGLDFVWGRTYHSRIGRNGLSVNGWTFSYDVHVQSAGGDILVNDGTGRQDRFRIQGSGVYSCPEFFSEGTLSNNVFRLTFADTGYWEFNPLDGSASAGTLARIVDRNGNTISLNYTGGLLAQIVDDLGRTNTIVHDTAGRVASVTDFAGRTVSYRYYGGKPGEPGSLGDLAAVTSPAVVKTPNGNDFPLGKTTTYTYSTGYASDAENHLLLSIINATGQTTHQYVYQHNQTDLEFLRCRSVQCWTNSPTVFSYLAQTPTPANQFSTLRCIMNDPVGNVGEYFYDARNRCVKIQEFTGRATPGVAVTATVNRPTGKLRSTDQDYYECRAEWNNDSLCRKVVLFGGQTGQCLYESDFDKSTRARKRADCRVVREIACCTGADTDGDGTADLTQREWRYDYDPRFGSDPTPCFGKKLYVGNLPYSANARGPRQTTSLDGTYDPRGVRIITDRDSGRSKGFGFIKAESNVRGTVMQFSYDAHGNLKTGDVKVNHNPFQIQRFSVAYNPYGQCTAITNAPDANGYRRVDTFSYYSSGSQAGYLQSIAIDESGVHLTTGFNYDPRGNLVQYTDPRTNGWLCAWNALDQCVRVQTPINLTSRCTTDFFYDANDNLVQSSTEVRDATDAMVATRIVIRGFDRLHRLTRGVCSVDATHSLTNDFVYDGNNQCVLALGGDAVSGADSHQAVSFAYDERGMLFRQSVAPGSPDQSTTQYDYNPSGLVTRISDGLESGPAVTTFEYDGFAKYTGGGGKVQGVLGQKAKAWMVNNFEVHPVLGMKKFDWAPKLEGGKEGRALAWVETVWNKQCVEKDTTVRLARITDPMGNVTTFNYDANDNLTVVRHFGQTNDVPGTNGNVRLAESRYLYDELDRCVTSHDLFFDPATQAAIGDGACTTTFTYAPNDACSSITDHLGRATTYTYDSAGRMASVISPNERTTFAVLRDAAGNVTSCIQTDLPDIGGAPQVFSWTNVYDPLNRCVSTTDNVGNTHRCAYDSLSRATVLFNPKEYSIQRTYDLLGRCTFAVADLNGDGLFDLSQDIYSACIWSSTSDRLLASSDSHGNTTSYGYDSVGRCTSVTNADGTRLSLIWSPRSNLIQEIDANGTLVIHTYDLNDRCISNSITPGAGVAGTTTFETFAYDGFSRLRSCSSDLSTCIFDYDSLGNCTRNVSGGFGALTTYDSLGRRLTLTCPGGKSFSYGYDVLDQCTNILDSGVSLASFSYAGPGRVARVNYGNRTRTQITYDGFFGAPNVFGDFGQGEVSSVTHALPVQGAFQKMASVDLKWDRNGNKFLRTDTIYAPSVPRTNNLSLTYDPADRLTRATVFSGTTLLRDTIYGLDQTGNRTNVIGAACSGTYAMSSTAPPADFQMNQYTAIPCDTRSYDEMGNLINRTSPVSGPVTFQYDCANRLVLVQALDFNTGALAPVASYAYDALGRRISKTLYSGGLPSVTTLFVYDGDDVIEERSNGALTQTFCYSRLFRAENLRQRAFEDRIAAFSGTGALQYYFHADDQGNLLALTGPGANVLERYDYDDYGAVTFLTSDGVPTGAASSSVGNVYCWGGLRLDSETGLQNDDGGGYLEPQTGRAIRGKVKTIKDMGGSGRTFQNNNPWSGGFPPAMKTGTVKFFNEAKGFGRVTGRGNSGNAYAMYGVMK
jgi:YD repeat-containing protein